MLVLLYVYLEYLLQELQQKCAVYLLVRVETSSNCHSGERVHLFVWSVKLRQRLNNIYKQSSVRNDD